MMTRHVKAFMLLGLTLILWLSGCNRTGAELPVATLTPIAKATTLAYPLATPYSQEPAAGICASFDGDTVTVSLNPDIPDPRCSKVRADQKLKVINLTLNTLQVSLGVFNNSLLPGGEYLIDVPFGDYLAAGVHQLQVSPCCSAELWLEEK
ncbi:MAG: hypothetical protein A2032_01395 [Chloroflexi bacterium RBG_19FT_COMBO_49_13]|nr:MAG: hypothetical protein A2032_01395 [Chloroflexi bacterium RBG_19FT_COMBO_49_13]